MLVLFLLFSPYVHSAVAIATASLPSRVSISATSPLSASAPVPSSFVSFSIELVFFPDFAGNFSSPNNFSYNLLSNLGNIQGTYPIVRVGGNSQDQYIINVSQAQAVINTYTVNESRNYPPTITIGPSFFESYRTWPGVQFIHGFNLAKSNDTVGIDSLLTSVPFACRALQGGKLLLWELGNEPDLYSTSSQGRLVRPRDWKEGDYVTEWVNLTTSIRGIIASNSACKGLTENFLAPSFGGTSNALDPIITWRDGLDEQKHISLISSHNYIGDASKPGVTLQGTLMNHSSTVTRISHQLNESSLLAYTDIPFILGETNSLFNDEALTLSNTFGAALWGVDFSLYCAAKGIKRIHMHQGSDFHFGSWQPIGTVNTTKGTKPPYYGNIAVVNALGDLKKDKVSVVEIGPLPTVFEAAYAAYVNKSLKRIILVQMKEYNYTKNTQGPRLSENYEFQLPKSCAGLEVSVQRLMANGSDALSGITFDGYSYNYELEKGKPVLLSNVTRGEKLTVGKNGVLSVHMPWSSAAIMTLVY